MSQQDILRQSLLALAQAADKLSAATGQRTDLYRFDANVGLFSYDFDDKTYRYCDELADEDCAAACRAIKALAEIGPDAFEAATAELARLGFDTPRAYMPMTRVATMPGSEELARALKIV